MMTKRKERHLLSAVAFTGTWQVPLLVLESCETHLEDAKKCRPCGARAKRSFTASVADTEGIIAMMTQYAGDS